MVAAHSLLVAPQGLGLLRPGAPQGLGLLQPGPKPIAKKNKKDSKKPHNFISFIRKNNFEFNESSDGEHDGWHCEVVLHWGLQVEKGEVGGQKENVEHSPVHHYPHHPHHPLG